MICISFELDANKQHYQRCKFSIVYYFELVFHFYIYSFYYSKVYAYF